MLDWLKYTAGLFALFGAIFALQVALSHLIPSVFSRTGVFYSRKKRVRELRSRFEMHAFATSFAIVISTYLVFRDGFQVEILYIYLFIPLAALLELSENVVSWNSKGVVRRRFIFQHQAINWDDVTALSIGMPLDGIVFSDGRTRIEFKARFAVGQHGEMYEPPKDIAFGVRALARYARMKLRNKPGLNWRAS